MKKGSARKRFLGLATALPNRTKLIRPGMVPIKVPRAKFLCRMSLASVLLLMTGISVLIASAVPEELKKGVVISKRIAPEESHHYTVNLKKDQFLLVNY